MTKQHGMLFAGGLMPPLLDGRKTQTRRPVNDAEGPFWGHAGYEPYPVSEDQRTWSFRHKGGTTTGWAPTFECPFGGVGDLIWARETWQQVKQHGHTVKEAETLTPGMLGNCYRADREPGRKCPITHGMVDLKWRPSIHMPKWACRCWLEVTDVRVERIQDISEEGAIAEGVDKQFRTSVMQKGVKDYHIRDSYRGGFANMWNKVYPGSWDRNDWVWALTFKRVESPQ